MCMTLKTIPTHQVTLGMHIHALNGAWIDHPFWKSKFVIEDPDDLKKLKTSSIKEVIIDVSKGLDVSKTLEVKETLSQPPTESAPEPVSEPPAPPQKPAEVKRVSAAEERAHAKKILQSSKKAVTSMLNDARLGKAVDATAANNLVDEITSSVSRNESALISLVR